MFFNNNIGTIADVDITIRTFKYTYFKYLTEDNPIIPLSI